MSPPVASSTLIYGEGHAYARSFNGNGTEQSMRRMTRNDLAAYHAAQFKPNNATLLVVGDTTLAEIKPMLEKAFAGWKPGQVVKPAVATVAPPAKPVVYLVDRPGAPQSMIVTAKLAPPRNDPQALPLEVVNDVFGGTFSSRINLNLREDKHWSYGVRSYLSAAVGQRPLIMLAPVQTDKTAESVAELVREYRDLAGGKPITAQELQFAQGNKTLRLPGTFETAAQLTGAYSTIVQYGLPEDYYDTYTQTVLGMTPEQANALAKSSYDPNQLVWVVIGDMSKIEQGVRALDIGEVRRIDADGKRL